MQKQLKDIANIKFGLYVKPLEKGFAKYLQAKNFDDFGNLQNDIDAFVLPGGMPGSSNLNAYIPLKELLISKYKEEKIIAAICAAPLVLGGLGLLKGRSVTCYSGFDSKLIGATLSGGPVEVDGNIITGKGPGLVFHFGLAIVKALKGTSVAEEVASGLLL